MTQATLIAATTDTKAAYLANRAAWRNLAHAKANSAEDHTRYILTTCLLQSDRLGAEAAKAIAYRKLKEAFTPSKTHGRRALEDNLYHQAHYGREFNTPIPAFADSAARAAWNAERKSYRALASYFLDELKLEG